MVASSAWVQRSSAPGPGQGPGMFGAQEHPFRLGVPLTEREVADFERHHGIVVRPTPGPSSPASVMGPWPLRRYRTVLRPATRYRVGRGPRGGNPGLPGLVRAVAPRAAAR